MIFKALKRWLLPDRSKDTEFLTFAVNHYFNLLRAAVFARFTVASDLRSKAIDMIDDAQLCLDQLHHEEVPYRSREEWAAIAKEVFPEPGAPPDKG